MFGRAAVADVMALGTASLKSYADFEQLKGGIETLFGANGAKSVEEYADIVGKSVDEVRDQYKMLMEAQSLALENASAAYKTAGLSQNEYMETVTSFAASLKQSTENEVEAAKAADQAVIDMADNANKMGTNMEAIQNAYQGFAKQNYTMLDNLKLGYGGTKTEMERLLKDAQAISGIKYDINNLSDVYEAIHVIQTELGITDTTAKEASTTISGSLNAVKASWENLTTAIASGEGIEQSLDAFIDSVMTAGDNIIPRIEVIAGGIVDVVQKLIPRIAEKAPELIDTGLEFLTNFVSGFIDNVPKKIPQILSLVQQLVSGISQKAPMLIEKGFELLSNLVDGFVTSIPEKLPEMLDFVQQFADGIAEKVPLFIEKGFEFLQKLVEGIVSALPILIEKVPTIITTFADIINNNFPTILLKGAEIIWNLIKGIVSAIPTLIENIPQIIEAIVSVIQAFGWLNLGRNIITWFKDGILSMVSAAKNAGTTIFNSIHNAIYNLPSTLSNLGRRAIQSMSNGIGGMLGAVKNAAANIVTGIVNAFSSLPGQMLTIGKNIISGIWSGISSGWSWLVGKVRDVAGSLFDSAKEALGVKSPSRKFKWLAEMCVAGWDEGAEDLMNTDNMTKNINSRLSALKMNITGAKASVGSVPGYGTLQQIININRQVSTPDEMARAIRLESKYGLMRGVSYG